MGATLKLTAALYLLMGLGINASLISNGLIKNHDRTSVEKSWNRLAVVPIIISQIPKGEDPAPPPDDKLSPADGGSAGGRCVEELVDVSV